MLVTVISRKGSVIHAQLTVSVIDVYIHSLSSVIQLALYGRTKCVSQLLPHSS
jgi:hypothetical protein